MEDRNRWIMHIKTLRERNGFGIIEAEGLALADPSWRRWVEKQINSDTQCRRMALSHIRYNGEASLIVKDGEMLKVR